LEVLAALPESRATLEQGFDIRLDLRQLLVRHGEVRQALQRRGEAGSLAERMNETAVAAGSASS
jgi:hypothetical protein